MGEKKIRVIGPVEADCPEDGGKWALHCEHLVDGEWLSMSVMQDTNKKRLAEWKTASAEWCCECQEACEIV